MFVSLPLSKLREVNTQLNLMGAFIYHAHQGEGGLDCTLDWDWGG